MTLNQNFPSGSPAADAKKNSFKSLLLFLVSIFGLAFCMTVLFHSQRVVMRMGGFVARGGPYEIAHPAPGWVWMAPVSILVGLFLVFLNLMSAWQIRAPNLMPLAWPALFVSLGWNFLEFGFWPPGQSQLAWGWIICGLVFIPMGLFPLYSIVKAFRQGASGRARRAARGDATFADETRGRTSLLLVLQLAAVLVAILLGRAFFFSQAYPASKPAAAAQTEKKEAPALERTAQVELVSGGRALVLAVDTSGRWRLVFEGQRFDRVKDLPAAVRQNFQKALAGLRAMLAE